jgi:hypothetical protein
VIGKSHEGGPGRSLILAAQAGPVGGERGERREGDQDQDQDQKGIVKATTRSGGTVRGRTGGEEAVQERRTGYLQHERWGRERGAMACGRGRRCRQSDRMTAEGRSHGRPGSGLSRPGGGLLEGRREEG